MKYLCLIYSNEAAWSKIPQDEIEKLMAGYREFTDGIMKSGQYLNGNRLQPAETATTVRVRNGKVSTTDGPFAETKEQLGGYYLLEAKDLDEALQLAAKIPGARVGSVEVRPVWELAEPRC